MARWYSDTTQIAWICEMLIQAEEISHACEYEAVKGWRLSAVIYELKEKYDWPILHRDGKKNVRYYRLCKLSNPDLLKKPKSYLDYLVKKSALKVEEGNDAATSLPTETK